MSRTEYQIQMRISQKILTKTKINHFYNLSKLLLKK